MKIAFIGAQGVGKSTLIEEFIKRWPMYKKPEKTYRDIIKEKGLVINKEATKDTQKIILNALVDEVQEANASEDKFLVFDRCVVDNIAYSLWHHGKNSDVFTSEFIIDCQAIAAMTLKSFDIIFYVPARKEIPLVAKENRETEELFQEEMDNIFAALFASYEKNTGAFFPKEDCPAVIKLDGPPDMRLPQIKLYVKDNGGCYGEEDGSLLSAEV